MLITRSIREVLSLVIKHREAIFQKEDRDLAIDKPIIEGSS
jgi:hypothetical protein